jgi:dipeptidyl aminopeptidase/acylaminoacyl peptidase
VLVTANADGYTRMRVHDPMSFAMLEELPLPRAGGIAATLSHDGSTMAFGAVSSVAPGDVHHYDLAKRHLRRLTTSPNPVDHSIFVEPTLHHVTSFDGERIPVFLYRPRVPIHDPAPVLVVLHGGPEGQHRPTFSAVIQYLVYRGYAVAAPNVRGSVGYGKRFHHLDDVDKRLDSVRDLEAIHAWIGRTPGLDPARAALWGGSYGGYMVLAGLAFQPRLWAAGVDIVGISNLVTFLENTSAYRRKMREREYGRLDRDRDLLERASPINRVEDIRAPLFIIHGRNDPRVPVGEAEQIHAALRRKGIATDLLVYDDEGHGLSKLKNRLDAYPKAVDFLDRVLLPSASANAE